MTWSLIQLVDDFGKTFLFMLLEVLQGE